jgi:acyl-CoA reductase-like NAD-dependent aldehyde dehydrogenase
LSAALLGTRHASCLQENADKIAELISAERGKTHDDALGEVTRGLGVVELAVGIPHLLEGVQGLSASQRKVGSAKTLLYERSIGRCICIINGGSAA